MSLFKKPKKNIRQRIAVNNYSDEENETSNDATEKETPKAENDDSMDTTSLVDSKENSMDLDIKKEKKKKKKHKDKEKAVISFIDEEEEEEVFQVKKSSQSRRLMKQMEKEKKMREMQKKEVTNGDTTEIKKEPVSPRASPAPADGGSASKRSPPQPPILSGREAEMAGYNSSDDEKGGARRPPGRHAFAPRDSLDSVLKGGAIPDAAMIHAVRKRREQARRQHEAAPEFIPVGSDNSGSASGRAAHREDDDSGPEDDRITFTVSTAARDREARRDQFNAARDQEGGRGSDEDDQEIARWENQQIKKAFSGAQMASVTAEHYLLPTGEDESGAAAAAARLADPLGRRQRRPLAELTPDLVRQRLQQKLSELRVSRESHVTSRDRALDDLVTGQSEIDRLEREAPRAARRYQYYQDIRGYVTDLIECFNEKMGLIEELENKLLEIQRARAQRLVQRRRRDVRDQRLELDASTQKSGIHFSEQSAEEVAARRRRAAEREGRRTRRRRARELSAAGGADHQDGLSSDDETAPADGDQYIKDRDAVLRAAETVLDDVDEEFSTLSGVCRHFLEWRRIDPQAYRDAFVSLSLPKALAPLVRLQMLGWNPLTEGECPELEGQPWFAELVMFGAGSDPVAETEDSIRDDPDCLLVSRVLERTALPKITALVERVWDPLSHSQTLRLVHLVRQLARDYPTVTGASGPLRRLLRAVIAAFTDTVREDAAVPRFSKQQLENRSTPAAVFFYRQFTSCVKLLGNMLSWTELLSDAALQRLALGTLLNEQMLLPLTQVPDPTEAANRCRLVANTLPRDWFQGDSSVPQLNMFVSYLSMLAVQLGKSANKAESLKSIAAVLKKVGATEAHQKVTAMVE